MNVYLITRTTMETQPLKFRITQIKKEKSTIVMHKVLDPEVAPKY